MGERADDFNVGAARGLCEELLWVHFGCMDYLID